MVVFQPFSDISFVQFASDHTQSKISQFTRLSMDLVAVPIGKNQCSDNFRSLVAINKRVVHDDVEQIRGSHLKRKSVNVILAKGRLRLRDRRLKQSEITNGRVTSVVSRLVNMKGQHHFNLKELNACHLFG
jgi:hypothetical protein